MTVRTDHLATFAAALVANTETVVATVPAGERWLVREVDVQTGAVAGAVLSVLIRTGATSYVVRSTTTTVSPQTIVYSSAHIVLRAGDELRVRSSVAAGTTLIAHGSRLVT